MNRPLLFATISFALTLAAALFDWRTRRIPNFLTVPAIVLAPLLHGLLNPSLHEGLQDAEASGLGILVCGAVPMMAWKLGWVGGGDVKLTAAMGALAGPALGIESVFLAFLGATAVIVLRLAYQGTFLATAANSVAVVAGRVLPAHWRRAPRPELGGTIRFGPLSAFGAAMTLLFHGGLG